jgi:hypothetical protein
VPEVGVPNRGVTNVGLVAKTNAPVPVSSVTAVARLELEGVARNVATPLPSPDTPVEIGRPVVFVSVPDVGVPSAKFPLPLRITNVFAVAAVSLDRSAASPVVNTTALPDNVIRLFAFVDVTTLRVNVSAPEVYTPVPTSRLLPSSIAYDTVDPLTTAAVANVIKLGRAEPSVTVPVPVVEV